MASPVKSNQPQKSNAQSQNGHKKTQSHRSPIAPLATQIAQLQKGYGNKVVARYLQSYAMQQRENTASRNHLHPPIQAKWIEKGDEDFKWDYLIDGVRWYSDHEGLMYYVIEEPEAIKAGKLEDYQESEGTKKTHEVWLANSVFEGDLLGGMDASTVPEEESFTGVRDTSKMQPAPLFSQFKDFFELGGNRLLSVFKGKAGSGQVLKEVAMLNRIAGAGLRTPNATVVEVIYKGQKTLGIAMDKVTGYFVDIHKIESIGALGKAFQLIAGGQPIDKSCFSEMGIIRLIQKPTPEANEEIKQQLLADLNQILSCQEEMMINDLQAIVGPDGHMTIIDPQWAGAKSGYVGAEREAVLQTYHKVRAIMDMLREEESKKSLKKGGAFGRLQGGSGFGGSGFGGSGGGSFGGPFGKPSGGPFGGSASDKFFT